MHPKLHKVNKTDKTWTKCDPEVSFEDAVQEWVA